MAVEYVESFIVTLKNMYYGGVSAPSDDDDGVENGEVGVENGEVGVENDEVGVENDEVGVENDEVGAESNIDLILNAIDTDPKITQKDIAAKTKLSARTVSREIQSLRDSGVIRRVGSDRSGYWERVRE